MTLDWQLAIWAVGIIFVGGGMYFDLRARMVRMEKMTGNGHPGVFLRRDEVKAMIQEMFNEAHERRTDRLERRLDDLESGGGR